MFSRGANKNSVIASMESYNSLGVVNYNETDHFNFYNLRSSLGEQEAIYLTDELKTYVDVYFQQVEDDFITNPGKNTKTIQRLEARQCEAADFGDKPWLVDFYESWDGFSIVCPHNPEGQAFKLEGDANKMHAKYFEFVIDRCVDVPGKPQKCKSPTDINKFIDVLQV